MRSQPQSHLTILLDKFELKAEAKNSIISVFNHLSEYKPSSRLKRNITIRFPAFSVKCLLRVAQRTELSICLFRVFTVVCKKNWGEEFFQCLINISIQENSRHETFRAATMNSLGSLSILRARGYMLWKYRNKINCSQIFSLPVHMTKLFTSGLFKSSQKSTISGPYWAEKLPSEPRKVTAQVLSPRWYLWQGL